jgi:protoporphyrinogen/coproporphyrinogen III oxidase
MASVAVIGGGISGLAAAYRLQQRRLQVQLFEATARIGGVIRSEKTNGYLAEWGPNSIQDNAPLITTLIRELGLEAQRLEASPHVHKRYIWRAGQLLTLPVSPRAFLMSRLLSLPAKLRVLREPLVPPGDAAHEESVADFVRRRFGREVLEYVVNPFVTGVYAGNPECLSVRYAFPKLYAVEQQYGSVIKGQWQMHQARQQRHMPAVPSETPLSSTIFSFRDGMQTLPDALCARLGDVVHMNTPVQGLAQTSDGWTVTAQHRQQYVTQRFDAVLYTAPLYHLPAMGLQDTPEVHTLARVYYPPLSILVLGFRRAQVRHPLDGFGLLVPAVEPLRIFGTLFSSTMFPGRAPDGHVTLTVFIGGARQPALACASPATLLEVALQDLRTVLGVVGTPTYVQHIFWDKAVPQYELGYGNMQGVMAQLETQYPGFFMAGNYRQGIAIGDALTSGYAAAERIACQLGNLYNKVA